MNNAITETINEIALSSGEFIEFSAVIKEKGNNKIIVISFKDNRMNQDGIRIPIREPIEDKEIIECIEDMIKSVGAINKLNEYISEYQSNSEKATVMLEYRFGQGDETLVADWNYDKVSVRLSKKAISSLKCYVDSLGEIHDLDYYNGQLIDIVNNFNECSIHKAIGAKIDNKDIYSVLSNNMLHRKDVLELIKSKSSGTRGKQKIKSVLYMREMEFIGILIWDIDYSLKTINVEIAEDKVLDVNNNRYIRDDVTLRSIYNIISVKAYEIADIFI